MSLSMSDTIRSHKTRRALLTIIVVVGFCVFDFFSKASSIGYTYGENALTITSPSEAASSVVVAYEDILSVSKTPDLEPGTNLSGVCTDQLWFGSWQNEDYGTYTLCANPDVSDYVVLQTSDGFVVCNDRSTSKTEKLYTALLERLDGK